MLLCCQGDTTNNGTRFLYDGHCHPPCRISFTRGGTHLPGGDQEPRDCWRRPGPVPHPTGECRLRAADESFERQPESVSRFVSQTNPKTEPTVDSTPLETADTHDQRTPPSSLCRSRDNRGDAELPNSFAECSTATKDLSAASGKILMAANRHLTENPSPPTSVSGTIFVVRRDRFQQLSVEASHASFPSKPQDWSKDIGLNSLTAESGQPCTCSPPR